MRDWTGNKRAIPAILAINTKYNTEYREENDFYATDPKAMVELLKKEDFNPKIWEPSCGAGNLSKVMEKAGYEVRSTDLIDRGYGQGGVDFFKCHEKWDGDIITNPPYKYATEYILHALDLVNDGAKVALFLKITFLEGKTRYQKIFKENPPLKIYVATNRLECGKNNKFTGQGMVCYAWFIWEKGNFDFPYIDWINTNENENQQELF